ncbi:MAG: potassium transporter TrkG [Gammaproteobacteria bacterium]|jgi:trk system potassium uptake protein TrkH
MPDSSAIRGLHFAVRPRVIAKYLGQAFLVLAVLTCVPAAVALLGGATAVALRYLGVIAGFALYGALTAWIRVPPNMQRNEALVITALVFTLSSCVMAFPLAGYGIAFIDALFEAVSGVTTTGLTVLASVEDKPAAFLFGRAWLQWVGGLGVLVLVLALLLEPGVASRRLGLEGHLDIAGGAKTHARRVSLAYLVLTLVAVFALLGAGQSWLDAVVHGFTSVSTAGFSNYDDSLAGLDSPAARAIVTLASLAGAISFSWYYLGYYRRASSLVAEAQFRGLLVLCALSVAALFGFLSLAHPERVAENLANAVMTGISAQTTTGFASMPLAPLDPGSKLALITAMFIGGELGSTSGGLKVLRLMVLLSLLRLLVQRVSIPVSGRVTATVDGSPLRPDEIEVVVALLVSYLGVVLVSWAVFLVHGYPALDALFEVVSAVATAGLSVSVASPALEPALKAVLCVDMLVGRVEILAFVVLLYPRTWIGRRKG